MMEQGQFEKIQGWFETLNEKVGRIEDNMATKGQLEGRFQLLTTAINNVYKKIDSYRDQ